MPGSGSPRQSSEQAKPLSCEAYILSSYGEIHCIVCCKGECSRGGWKRAGQRESLYVFVLK